MADLIITPSTGKIEFIHQGGQAPRVESIILHQEDGLVFSGKISASSVTAPLNVINVTAGSSNVNYPFIFASSGETGAKSLLMDSVGGTYNPFTNTATIDVSGNSATTTLASNSSQLNGQADSFYTNITARLGYTPVNKAGDTVSGNLTVNGNFSVNGSFTAFSASNIYLSSSVLTIEDNILTLNAFSPYLRYAGIEMYDSGSGTLSQLLWDGEGDYFFLTGSSVNGKIITGPDTQANLTANFVPKATAGYKLGNSLIYDNGTNVGIGTTSPAAKLQVNSTSDIAYAILNTTSTTNKRVRLQFTQNDNAGMELGSDYSVNNSSNFYLYDRVNGVTFAYFSSGETALNPSGGNVGIGTGSPTLSSGRGLHINSTSGHANLKLQSSGRTWEILSTTAGYFSIFDTTGATDRLSINSSGNVGIGTTSPAAKLDVTSATDTFSLINATNAAQGNRAALFMAARNVNGNVGNVSIEAISVNNQQNDMVFRTGATTMGGFGTERMRITNTGTLQLNVLATYGSMTYEPSITYKQSGATGVGGIYFGNSYNSNNNVGLQLRVSNDATQIQALTIAYDGNVGIGTTSPATKLDVYGPISIRGTNVISTGADIFGGLNYDIYGNIRVLRSTSAQGDGMYIGYGGSGGNLRFFSNSGTTEFMTIATSGNVGIGTTSPITKLDVRSGYITAGTGVSTSGTTIIGGYYSDGNLTILGTEYSSGGPMLGYGVTPSTTSAGAFLSSTGINVYRSAYTQDGGSHRWFTGAVQTVVYGSAVSMSEKMRMDTNGNVGIGTTSPTQVLHISSTNSGNNGLTISTTSATGNPQVRFLNSAGIEKAAITYVSSNDGVYFYTAASNSNLLNFIGSNVGIGTTSPNSKLQIGGTTAGLLTVGTLTNDWGGVVAIGTVNGNGIILSKVNTTNDSNRVLTMTRDDTDGATIAGYTPAGTSVSIGYFIRANASSYFNGGNVGIGTTSPGAKLQVVGTANVIELNQATTGSATYYVMDNTVETGGRRYRFGYSGASADKGSFTIYNATDNITPLTILTSGSVGIGTTSPTISGGGLQVYGSGQKGIRISGNSSNSYSVEIGCDSTKMAYIQTVGSLDRGLQLHTGNASTVVMTLTGSNVGIGTTSPIAPLDVQCNTGGTGIIIRGRPDNSTALRFYANDATTQQLYIGTDNSNIDFVSVSTRPIRFFVNALLQYQISQLGVFNWYDGAGGTRMTLNSTGLGIGTTSPTAKLHVYNGLSHFEATSNGNAAIVAGLYALQIGPLHDRDSTAGRYYGGIAFNHLLNFQGGTTYNGAPQAWIGTRLQDTAGSERDYLVFATKPGTGVSGTGNDIPIERMCIDRDGNVGIGTTSPAAKLDVVGSAAISSTLTVTGTTALNGAVNLSTSGTPTITLGSASSYGVLTASGTNAASIYLNGANRTGFEAKLQFGAAEYQWFNGSLSSQIMMLNTTGLGIGTTSPSSPLHVFNTAATLATFTRDLATDVGFSIGADSNGTIFSTAGSHAYLFYTNGTEKVRITSAGNVGIGTTSPATKLHIYENVNRVTYISQNDNHTARFEAYGTATAIDTTASNGIFFRINSADIVKFAADGNVGIGTSNATAPLHIYRASNPSIRINGGGIHSHLQLDDGTSYGYLIKNVSAGTGNGALAGALYTYTDNNKAFQHIHSGTPLFTILSGGNIGIGTTSPIAKLETYGGSMDPTLTPGDPSIFSVNSLGVQLAVGRMVTTPFSIWFQGKHATVGGGLTYPIVLNPLGGNVGIGVSSPAAKLDIAGTNTTIALSFGTTVPNNPLFINTYGSNTGIGMDQATAGLRLAGDYGGGSSPLVDIGYYSGGTVSHANWISRLKVLNNGNVGIGSNNPQYKLDVNGVLAFGGVAVLNTANNGNDIYANVRVIRNTSSTSADGMYINYDSAGTTAAHLRFYANAGSERMRIQANDGNVGIGTTSAGRKLDVEGIVRTRGASGTGGFEIGVASTGAARWRIEWDSASDSLDFNYVA